MACHMKTTIHIADSLLAEAHMIATRERTTLKALVDEGLRRVVTDRQSVTPFRLPDRSVGGDGLQPGIREAPWEIIRDLAYGDRG